MICFIARVLLLISSLLSSRHGVRSTRVRLSTSEDNRQSSGMTNRTPTMPYLGPHTRTSTGMPGVAREVGGNLTWQPNRSSASPPEMRTQVTSANESVLSDALYDVTPSSPFSFYYNSNGTGVMEDTPGMAHWTETLSTMTPWSPFFEQNGTTADGNPFFFYVVNEATLPVNFMALSSFARVHASVTNGMLPGTQTEVVAVGIKYDFSVSISNKNQWLHDEEIVFGLAKNLSSVALGHVIGAGITGKVAGAAGTIVAGALTAVLAPPVAAALGLVALVGTGVFTSMSVSAICEGSWNMLRSWSTSLLAQDRPWPALQTNGLFFFKDVATELDAQLAFASEVLDDRVRNRYLGLKRRQAMPRSDQLKVLDDIVMTQSTAEAYYAALQAVFSDQRMATTIPRRFVIAGGFTLPRPHEFLHGVKIVDFTPLSIAEDLPDHGCLPRDAGYWTRLFSECKQNCGVSATCVGECETELSRPLTGERERKRFALLASALVGKTLTLMESPDEILIATRAAGIRETMHDPIRLWFQGRKLHVHSVNVKDFTAEVLIRWQDNRLHVWFPLEVFKESRFKSYHRMALNHNMYGECWSRYSGGIWNGFRRTFSDGSWCYARRTGSKRPFGQVCFPADQDDCGNVQTDREWECVPRHLFSA